MRKLGIIFFAVLLLIGCSTDQQTMQLIERAEGVVLEHPDSALHLIRSVDADAIRGEEDMSRYRLVMAEACYYNLIVPSRDSIAEPLFEYYLDSDDHAMRARALYQHALVMQSDGENAKAMYSLLEAEKSLSHTDNHRLAGLVHRTKGDVYGDECLFSNAKAEYEKAQEIFSRIGLNYHVFYCEYDIGYTLMCLHKFNEAETKLLNALEYAVAADNCEFTLLVLERLIDVYASLYDFVKIEDLLNQHEYICDLSPGLYYQYKAILFANRQIKDDAIACLSLVGDNDNLDYLSYIVYKLLGDSNTALMYYEKCIESQNALILSSLSAPTLNLQIEKQKQEYKFLKTKSENTVLHYTIVVIVVFGILIILIAYYRYKLLKQKYKAEQYLLVVEELSATHQQSNQMSKLIEALYSSRLEEMNKLYDVYYDSFGSEKQTRIVCEQLRKIIESVKSDKKRLKELEDIVNNYRSDVVVKLHDLCPNLSERQKRIALYSYAGFSLRAIALFMGSNPAQISKDKYKIKALLRNNGVLETDITIKYM